MEYLQPVLVTRQTTACEQSVILQNLATTCELQETRKHKIPNRHI